MHCSSTNLDEIELAETFKTRIDMGERDPQYEHVEWVFLDDRNQQNYKKHIEFDTITLKDKLVIMRESYLLIPLRAKSSNVSSYTVDTMLAWKCSVLTLIRSLTVKATNRTLVNSNDGAVPLINNLKLLTCADLDWIQATGSELSFFGADRQVLTASDVVSVRPTSSQISAGYPGNDMLGNQQLTDRVTILASQADFDSGNFDMHVYIPLKYVHPLFDQMGFPLTNCPLNMQFGLSSVSNGESAVMPLTAPIMSNHAAVGADFESLDVVAASAPASKPSLEVVPSIEINGFTPGACRLYVKTVVLKPEDQKKLDSQLSGPGYKKSITYTVTDYHDKKQVATTTGGSQLHHVFGHETKRPVRVWALFPEVDAISNHLSTFPATMGLTKIKDVNLKINNIKFRSADYETQKELYDELRAYMLGSGYSTTQGAQISYNDFLHGMNPHLFDLSRNPTVRNNLPVTFTFDGKLIAPVDGTCDAIFLVERYKTVVFNITHNKAEVTDEDGLRSDI